MSAKTSAESKNRWNRENYDRAEVFFPKGKKAKIKAHAEDHNESMNQFINRAIDETIKGDVVAEEMAAEYSISPNRVKQSAEFANAVDMIEKLYPGASRAILSHEFGDLVKKYEG